MKQDIENIIKKNLPEKKDGSLKIPQGNPIDGYSRKTEIEKGFNQALSQINTSLIADEVLKVVVEKIKEEINKISKPDFIRAIRIPVETHYSNRVAECNDIYDEKIDEILQLLSNLSTNKENENNG